MRSTMRRMSSARVYAFSLGLACLGLAVRPAPGQDQVPVCGDSLRWRIPWGDGPECAARGDTTAGAFAGPLFEVRDGTVYLLDRLLGRLLVQPPHGGAVGTEVLPSLDGIPYSDVTDLRVAYGKVFLLALSGGEPSVFLWDLSARRREPLPLRLEGQMRPPETGGMEPYKLTVGPEGVYLLQRLSQWSVRIFDGAPVLPERQAAEEGLVVGASRLRLQMPTGVISTVSGRPLASGSLRATGNGRILVASRRDGVEVLEMHDLDGRTLSRTPLPARGRGRVQNMGTRYRIEDGYYEIYFDRAAISVVKWLLPGS
jgi:hypothetical protein